MLFDVGPEDVEFVSRFKWHLDHKGYVIKSSEPNKGARMHRIIAERMGLDIKGLLVDHKNGVKNDNHRDNLRVATNGQNRANSKLNRDNKSGLKGAHLKKDRFTANRKYKHRKDRIGDRWVAQININGKKYHLGYFDTKEKAHECYKEAAIKAFGEFASV